MSIDLDAAKEYVVQRVEENGGNVEEAQAVEKAPDVALVYVRLAKEKTWRQAVVPVENMPAPMGS